MSEEQYWEAVLRRDRNRDGAFVYAVRSTGIYCNPSCPARRPRREQVLFFASSAEAEVAGFRPCRRCRPQDPATDGLRRTLLMQDVCRYIEEHIEEKISLIVLSQQVHMSPYHLQRVFKQYVGVTPRQYVEAYRFQRLKIRLKEEKTVTAALYSTGYSSSSRLYERIPSHLGMTPLAYRKGGQGMYIHYTIAECPLGRLLVGATKKGICAMSLGDDDALLEKALRQEYPLAAIRQDQSELSQWVTLIIEHVQGHLPRLNLPLDVQATAFQWRVWTELQAIPYGKTRTYGEVAQALGDRKKARAVAQACASNPIALVIPCHRVIQSDGAIGGYRWGVGRKQALITQERETKASNEKYDQFSEHP